MDNITPDVDCAFFSHPQERDSGDYLHRVLWPAQALGEHLSVTSIQSIHPEYVDVILKTRVLIVCMVANDNILEIIHARNSRGLITVYEISDDFESFPQTLPSFAFYADPGNRKLIRTIARAATAVQFSSSVLEKKYRSLNQRHAVFLNQCAEIPRLSPIRNGRISIGWAGSVGHYDDAVHIADILAQWPQIKKVRLMIMAATSIVDIFTSRGLQVRSYPPGSMEDYLAFLNKVDVGIVLAGTDDFSSGRSDGKFIEYASRGVIAVCSKTGEYAETVEHENTGFLYDQEQPEMLLDVLGRLASDIALRKRVRQQAYDHLLSMRTHQYASRQRLDFYQSLVADASVGGDPLNAHTPGFHQMIHPIEDAFLHAMLLHRQGNLKEALVIYSQLLQQVPDFYYIWEMMGMAFAQMGLSEQADICAGRCHDLSPFGGVD